MTGSSIVRLIDVVLIILFGFIAISDMKVKRQIKFPGAQNKTEQKETHENVLLWVNIDDEGRYDLEVNETVVIRATEISRLETAILAIAEKEQKNGKIPVVIIDPQPMADMQATIFVFDMCEKNNLIKSININKAIGI